MTIIKFPELSSYPHPPLAPPSQSVSIRYLMVAQSTNGSRTVDLSKVTAIDGVHLVGDSEKMTKNQFRKYFCCKRGRYQDCLDILQGEHLFGIMIVLNHPCTILHRFRFSGLVKYLCTHKYCCKECFIFCRSGVGIFYISSQYPARFYTI